MFDISFLLFEPQAVISFSESDLKLSFASRRWAVRKYDAHTYYMGLSGASLKGVDFLAIQEGRRLVFIEVKNYIDPAGRPQPPAQRVAAEIEAKIADTMTGIDAICSMLERKRLYRLAAPLLSFLPAQHYDWPFWNRSGRLIGDPTQCTAVCCLENAPEDFRQQVEAHLQGSLNGLVGRLIMTHAGNRPLPGLHIAPQTHSDSSGAYPDSSS